MAVTICLDLDGVFANFSPAYAKLLIEEDGLRLPEDWETSPNWPTTWYWERAAGYSPEIEKRVWERILQRGSKFWQTLEPLPEARETLMMLNSRQRSGDHIWFVSTRMGDRAHIQTMNWLYDHGIDFPCVFFAADKVPYLRLLKANFFVDDKLETCNDLARVMWEEKWQDFKLFLKDAPYNREGRNPNLKIATSAKDALQQAGLWT